MSQIEHILVTGGCGYIGSHVTRQLSEAGFKVVVADNLSTGRSTALTNDEKLEVGDIGDVRFLSALFRQYKFKTVMHFAASIIVPESVANPLKYYLNNTGSMIQLLNFCNTEKVRNFIFSSTAAVYGEEVKNPVDETAPARPTSPYGRSKLMDEWILQDLANASDLRYVILRYFNVAGADPGGRLGQCFPEATHLIKVACEAALGKRDSVTIHGIDYETNDGTCVRDYVHVEDLATAHLDAFRYLETGGKSDLFNCGYGRGFSVREVLDAVQGVSGAKLRIRHGARRPGDVSALIADSTKARSTLGWQPKFDQLDVIVDSSLRWERRMMGL